MKTHRRDAGFSLSALIFFATATSILIAAGVPAYQMQARREMEEELIFRGEEYTRAIQKYQRRFGVYPTSIDQLVSTNGLRFVRRAYQDPTTGKEFRLILINPDGSVTGSKLFQQNINNQSMFGNNTQQFGQGQNSQQQPQQQGQQRGQPTSSFQTQSGFQSTGQGGQFQSQAQNQNQAQNNSRGGGIGTSGGGSSFGGQQNQQGQQGQRNSQIGGGNTGFGSQLNGGNPGNGTTISGGGVIGVASDNSKESIKIYNNRQKYDEWEFVAIMGQQGQRGQQNPQQNQQNQQNGLNQQQNQFGGGQRQNGPASPFGGQPTGSAFGAGGGQRQLQPQPQPSNPFGFGGNNQPNQQNQPGKR